MYLITILKERNISKLQLALKAGVTPSDLYQAINGKIPFYPAWKKRISEYLKIDENELFKESEENAK